MYRRYWPTLGMAAALAINLRARPALVPVILCNIFMIHSYLKIYGAKTAQANLDSRSRGIILSPNNVMPRPTRQLGKSPQREIFAANLLIVQVAIIFFSIGPGKQAKEGGRIPPQVKSGDRVLSAKYSGSEVKIDGVEHIIMGEDDILGYLT